MADEPVISTPAPAASEPGAADAPVPAPVETPAAEPAKPETPAETPAEKPVDAPAEKPAEAPAEKPADETPAEAKKPETLLGEEKKDAPEAKKEEEKPAENKEEAPKPEEEKPAELPAFEEFKLPEGIEVDAEKIGEFTKTLGEFENTTKASHEEVQKFGQQMLDRHLQEMQRYTDSLTQAWEKQKTDWKEAFQKDPEFVNRTDTVVNAALDAIKIYGGDEKQRNEFHELMESTGIGNHPAMIRLLSNIMIAKAEPKPLAAPPIVNAARISKIEKMYGKKA